MLLSMSITLFISTLVAGIGFGVLSTALIHALRKGTLRDELLSLRDKILRINVESSLPPIVTSELPEIRELTEPLNILLDGLYAEIRQLSTQRDEKEAMLSCMVEGVIALNSDERIIIMNNSAREMSSVSSGEFSA